MSYTQNIQSTKPYNCKLSDDGESILSIYSSLGGSIVIKRDVKIFLEMKNWLLLIVEKIKILE